mgnify:FL=1
MSHGHERNEKNCLNCNARVFGRYCHVCGQENIVPKESIGGLLVHYFNDITHFEGKFITTLRYLLFRPGFLSKEYERGRRAAYMNPIRMYIFTSAFFFIIFFSIFKVNDTEMETSYNQLQNRFRNTAADFNIGITSGDIRVDGVKVGNINNMSALNEPLIDSLLKAAEAAVKKDSTRVREKKSGFNVMNFGRQYGSITEYDSVQNSLPAAQKDGWLMHALNRKGVALNNNYSDRPGLAIARITDVFLHKLPTILFVSLPLFALLLLLLYIRHRNYNYVNHVIFSVHYYIFCFINFLAFFAADKLGDITSWSMFGVIKFILFLSLMIYLYKAIRNYYMQGRFKTIIKFSVLTFLFFIIIIMLFAGFLLFSAFNI